MLGAFGTQTWLALPHPRCIEHSPRSVRFGREILA